MGFGLAWFYWVWPRVLFSRSTTSLSESAIALMNFGVNSNSYMVSSKVMRLLNCMRAFSGTCFFLLVRMRVVRKILMLSPYASTALFEFYKGATIDVYWFKMSFVGVDKYKRPIEAVEGVADEGACCFGKEGSVSYMHDVKNNSRSYVTCKGFV